MISKEQFISIKSIEDLQKAFSSKGFKFFQDEDEIIDFEIANDTFMTVSFYENLSLVEKQSKAYSLGTYLQLFIRKDFEEWIFTKRILEDGVKIKKYKFSKETVNNKSSFLQRLNELEYGKLSTFDALFQKKDITKKFYDEFKKLLDGFIKDIKGISDLEDQKWYASVLINRLMFTYFVQHKGLLGDNPEIDKSTYLTSKLRDFSKKKKDSFYKEFLLTLFFEGFAKSGKRTKEVEEVLGIVPYLNGGLFQKHGLELKYKDIQISDKTFAKIFEFFDKWSWNIGDWGSSTDENEINPEVLGYIFEKFTNQKQMGAYYTKEDITGYICKNTIIPRIFDMAEVSGKAILDFLKKAPDTYIYDAVKHGVKLDLPKEIEKGISKVSERTLWNTTASEEYGLPTEIWREVVARRQRYEEVKSILEGNDNEKKIESINDLITYNLNIIQFALDFISQADEKTVSKIYACIREITVLDPTCGSGAFLFAALNILEDLYEACLNRMSDISKKHPALNEASSHANWKYYIYKSIILNNLYGVDIMEEAVEICKLRLFLKLISQVERVDHAPNLGIEPLPDIDFNIFAGNTLVGFAKKEEVETYFQNSGQLNFFAEELERIEKQSGEIEVLHDHFLARQKESGGEILSLKQKLQKGYHELNEKLNLYLANIYGIDTKKIKQYEAWKLSHKPFHWIVSFYGIMKRGGFDVIVGNPPYVEYSKVKKEYEIKGYKTEICGNLYVYVMERNQYLMKANSFTSMIVPHSVFCTDRMESIIDTFIEKGVHWISTYSIRPGKLFVGVDQRLGIYISRTNKSNKIFTTTYHHWSEEFRSDLFFNLAYVENNLSKIKNSILKVGNTIESKIVNKVMNFSPYSFSKKGEYRIYYHNAPRYWIRGMNFIPYFYSDKNGEVISSHVKELSIPNEEAVHLVLSILNSSLFFFWFIISSNCRDMTLREIENFPHGIERVSNQLSNDIKKLTKSLINDFQKNAVRKETNYTTTGKVIYDEYYPKLSKPIIDEIDKVLAKHYGFTEEELDYIINYDIKYRMGKELEGEE